MYLPQRYIKKLICLIMRHKNCGSCLQGGSVREKIVKDMEYFGQCGLQVGNLCVNLCVFTLYYIVLEI